jgi:hypothetical protein
VGEEEALLRPIPTLFYSRFPQDDVKLFFSTSTICFAGFYPCPLCVLPAAGEPPLPGHLPPLELARAENLVLPDHGVVGVGAEVVRVQPAHLHLLLWLRNLDIFTGVLNTAVDFYDFCL